MQEDIRSGRQGGDDKERTRPKGVGREEEEPRGVER